MRLFCKLSIAVYLKVKKSLNPSGRQRSASICNLKIDRSVKKLALLVHTRFKIVLLHALACLS